MKENQSCFQGRISVSLHHKIILTSLVCLAQLPRHRVPASLWSFTHEETCCSHYAPVWVPALLLLPAENLALGRQVSVLPYAYILALGWLLLSSHLAKDKCVFIWPLKTGQLTTSFLKEATRKPTKVLLPTSFHFSPLSGFFFFSPVIGSKNSATFPRAFLTGRILFSSWQVEHVMQFPHYPKGRLHHPVNGSSVIHNTSMANCAV